METFWKLLDEFVKEPRLLLMILTLSKQDTLTFREFVHESGFWQGKAQELRDRMENLRLISVEGKGVAGATQYISLTPHGREILELLLKMGGVLERAAEKASK
jgi:DNA-binding MarR family transcriptional regulator